MRHGRFFEEWGSSAPVWHGRPGGGVEHLGASLLHWRWQALAANRPAQCLRNNRWCKRRKDSHTLTATSGMAMAAVDSGDSGQPRALPPLAR